MFKSNRIGVHFNILFSLITQAAQTGHYSFIAFFRLLMAASCHFTPHIDYIFVFLL